MRASPREFAKDAWTIARLGALAWLAASCGISGGGSGPDNSPKVGLEIRDIRISPTDSSATVRWSTTQRTVGTIAYGPAQTSMSSQLSSDLSEQHSVDLMNLEPDTEYWYQITATNPLGPRAATQPVSFRTLVSPDLADSTAPVISDVEVVGITSNSATVLWSTDDRTIGSVHYGTSPAYGGTLDEPAEAGYARRHSVALAGLTEATSYHLRIEARNRAGLLGYSSDQLFETAPLPSLEITPDTLWVAGEEDFEFEVTVSGISNLAGISFMIAYDPDMVEIVSVREGDFWWDHDGFIPLMLETEDLANGRVQYACSWKILFDGTTPVGTLANGGGEVAIIKARARGNATKSSLRLIDIDENGDGTPDTRLLDHNRLPMSFRARNGCVIKQVK